MREARIATDQGIRLVACVHCGTALGWAEQSATGGAPLTWRFVPHPDLPRRPRDHDGLPTFGPSVEYRAAKREGRRMRTRTPWAIRAARELAALPQDDPRRTELEVRLRRAVGNSESAVAGDAYAYCQNCGTGQGVKLAAARTALLESGQH